MQHSILETVTQYADAAHGEQLRKYSRDRYIVHPVRVMKICKRYSDNVQMHAAALLHDVLEDTHVTADEMSIFLKSVFNLREANETLRMVVELTDIYTKKAYPHLKRRARKDLEIIRLSKISIDAQTIKYADIMDNAKDIMIHDVDFATVYLKESQRLLEEMNQGNKILYNEVLTFLEEGQTILRNNQ
jgi:guanosine-3',5'-bis(diphosphate) 3'-pyrophosphohydrolase